MSDLKPPDQQESSVPRPKNPPQNDSAPAVDPRKAILNAALVCLEYAKQYLDKFTYWPDYILATHYHANILSLSDPKNWRDAEKYFKDVEFWLEPREQQSHEEESRQRIRMEAMYNRAVLLGRRGKTVDARTLFEEVRGLMHAKKELAPKGIRFATDFALLMLTARELGYTSVQDQTSPQGTDPGEKKRQAELRTEWNERVAPFLEQCDNEMQLLRERRDLAEQELANESPGTAGSRPPGQLKSARRQPSLKAQTTDGAPSARITRASKDLAILRKMVEYVNKVERKLNSNEENDEPI